MLLVAWFLIILCLVSIGLYSVYGAANATTFLKGTAPYGVPYEDWVAKWWQWNLQIPKEKHPIVNANLTTCPVGDSDSVSFLSHKLQGESRYSCSIPADHAIIAPIGTGECTNDEAQSNVPEDMMRCATEGDKYLTFKASIDGVDLLEKTDPASEFDQKNYVKTKIFNVTVPADNFLKLKPGQWKAAAGGYFIFLEPLPAGDHRLSINARVTNPIDPSYNFNYNTLYLLRVH